MALHVVLVAPQIPGNTGNIARLCAGTNTELHLVEPLGFSLEDKYVRRAGLDYWPSVRLHRHACLEEVIDGVPPAQIALYSTHAVQPYTAFEARDESYLVFGRETAGLSKDLLKARAEQAYTIPITDNVRSLNLSNAVAVVLYDAWRQLGFAFPH